MSHHGDASSTGLGFRIREPHSSGTRGQVEGALGVQVHRANDVATHRCPPSGCSRRLGGLAITVPGQKIFASRTGQRSVLPCVRLADLSPDVFTVPGSHRSATPYCQARFHSAEVRSDVQPVSGKSEAPSVCWGLQGVGSVHVKWDARSLLQAGSEVCADRLHELS